MIIVYNVVNTYTIGSLVLLSLLNVTWVLFYVKNLYLKIRQALQFENAPLPQLLCLIFVLSACFILLKVINGMGCNEFGITLLETDILCLDRALVYSLACQK